MTEPDERPTLSDELFEMQEAPSARSAQDGLGLSWPDFLGDPPGTGEVVRGAAGFLAYALINLIVMWAPMHNSGAGTGVQAVVLVVVAFGFGSFLVWGVGRNGRPYGFGMMLGWVVLTLLSLGFATGLG
ncbi:hypothetical protein [Actinocorallia populi]|uniref:hypothetical protein n=1 Tax=Actinocorallia populi TaxID=2079200 RepID=UPI000D0880E6|nr:hypothetical protein [Actinocorallia populi]